MANQASGTIAGTRPTRGRSASVYSYRPNGTPVAVPIRSIDRGGRAHGTQSGQRRESVPQRAPALAAVVAASATTTADDNAPALGAASGDQRRGDHRRGSHRAGDGGLVPHAALHVTTGTPAERARPTSRAFSNVDTLARSVNTS